MPFIAVDFCHTLAAEDQNAGVVDIAPFDAYVYADGDGDGDGDGDRDFIVGSGIANHAEGRSVPSCLMLNNSHRRNFQPRWQIFLS